MPDAEKINQPQNGEENEFVKAMEDMPSFEEKMEDKANVLEKYFEQAQAMKDRYVQAFERDVEEAEKFQFDDYMEGLNRERAEHPEARWRLNGEFVDFDSVTREQLQETFEVVRAGRLSRAQSDLERCEKVDVEELAGNIRYAEFAESIAEKMRNGEEFTDEENEFLGEDRSLWEESPSGQEFYEALDPVFVLNGFFSRVATWDELINDDSDDDSSIHTDTHLKTVAKARRLKGEKEGRIYLHTDEGIQSALEDMEKGGRGDFVFETNINSETGEKRTYSREDIYPQLSNESDEDYAKRLRGIELKIRRFEKNN